MEFSSKQQMAVAVVFAGADSKLVSLLSETGSSAMDRGRRINNCGPLEDTGGPRISEQLQLSLSHGFGTAGANAQRQGQDGDGGESGSSGEAAEGQPNTGQQLHARL